MPYFPSPLSVHLGSVWTPVLYTTIYANHAMILIINFYALSLRTLPGVYDSFLFSPLGAFLDTTVLYR